MTIIKSTEKEILNRYGDINSIADDSVEEMRMIREVLK